MPEPTQSAPPQHPGIQRVREAAARKGVELDIRVFDESTHTAADASAALDAELGQIVKSLVFVAPGGDGELEPVLCLVSGPNRVDVARLAAVTGERDIRRATAREAQELTGFTIGGIPPFGHVRPVRTIMDPDLGRFQIVWAAAGTGTAVFPVPPATLRILANATVAPITEERRAADLEAEEQARRERERGAGVGELVDGEAATSNAGA
ncbi:MAG TPA: YbaK/EbsC family protein [Candidatus Limnocylindrales bacterium]|nr:YbaK/EbsC family protein [Candidatus Limnocylindrales bacterium]